MAFAVAAVLIIKMSDSDKSVIVSLSVSILKVSEPEPPVSWSFPAPPVIISASSPPVIISSPSSPVIIFIPCPPTMVSIPAPPVMVNPSVWALRLTLEPAVLASIVSILAKFVSEEKTWEPVDSFKTSAPAPPSKTSELPSPEAVIVKVSAPLLPFKMFEPDPPIIL